jgi:DNA invertase Pin-like site-specific DNA recombinase
VEDLEKSGAELYSHSERLSSDANGKMMLTILSAFNAKERSEIVYRTKFALSEKRKQNKLISNFVPYGYKKDSSGKNLIEIPHQQKIIVLMEKLRDSGLSFQKIADKINKLGEKTSTGKIFLRQTVNQTLQRRAKLVDPVTA